MVSDGFSVIVRVWDGSDDMPVRRDAGPDQEVLFHGAVTGPRVDPPGRAHRISPGVSQPETAIGQGQPGAGALVPEPGDRRADSGFRRPG
jgi:hypothetical protein